MVRISRNLQILQARLGPLTKKAVHIPLLYAKSTDTVSIKHRPKVSDFSVSKEFKKEILKTDLGKINITVTDKDTVQIPEAKGLEQHINSFIGIFPKFVDTFKHPKSDRDGLGTHTLRTFQELLSDSNYQKLGKKNKDTLDLAALFHDLGKIDVEGFQHPKQSKTRAIELLAGKEIPAENKNTIVKLVRYHYWGAIVKKNPLKMPLYAEIFSKNDLKLLKIMTTADIKSRKTIEPDVKAGLLSDLEANYKIQKTEIQKHLNSQRVPFGRPAEFAKDNKYRQTLVKELREEFKTEAIKITSADLKSVVGANEMKALLKNHFTEKNLHPGQNDINVKNGDFTANFHIHTVHSDGEFKPENLLEAAKEYADKIKKPVYFAITDHNKTEGSIAVLKKIALNPEKYKNVRFIPGSEILCNYKNEKGQKARYETLVYGLNPFRKNELFSQNGVLAYPPEEVAKSFKDEDVLFSLAHPKRVLTKNLTLHDFIKDVFIPNNGKAVESYYSYSEATKEEGMMALGYKFKPDEQETQEVKNLAEEFGLLKTGGRDSHGESLFHRRPSVESEKKAS